MEISLVSFLATRMSLGTLGNKPFVLAISIQTFRHLKQQNQFTGDVFLALIEVKVPHTYDPIMYRRSTKSITHL